MKNKRTTINVSKELVEKLKEYGRKGDIYEDIIWRIFEKAGIKKENP
jgi:uncharacterized FlgJ-related protein